MIHFLCSRHDDDLAQAMVARFLQTPFAKELAVSREAWLVVELRREDDGTLAVTLRTGGGGNLCSIVIHVPSADESGTWSVTDPRLRATAW